MQLKVYEITWGETQTATGTIAGNVVSYDIAFSDQGPVGPVGPQGIQGPQGLPGDFVVNFRVVSAPETLVSKAKIAANTSAGAFTLTLPANPTNGDVIDFYDYAETFDTNPLTLNRNGRRIEGQEENLICNVEGAYFSLVYSGSVRGWQVLPSFGTSGGGGESTLTTRGDTLYRGDTTGERLPIGTTGQVLKVSAQGLPTWANESGAVTSVNGRSGSVQLTQNDIPDASSTFQITSTNPQTPTVIDIEDAFLKPDGTVECSVVLNNTTGIVYGSIVLPSLNNTARGRVVVSATISGAGDITYIRTVVNDVVKFPSTGYYEHPLIQQIVFEWSGGNWTVNPFYSTSTLALPSHSGILAAYVPTRPQTTISNGTTGQIAYEDPYLYICVNSNSWRRVAIANW